MSDVFDLLDTMIEELQKENARMKAVVDAAQEQVDRWYRVPPVAEGGDFMAGMDKMKAALKALDDGSAG